MRLTERNQEVLATAKALIAAGTKPTHVAVGKALGVTGETVRRHRCKLVRLRRLGLIKDAPGIDWPPVRIV